MLLLTQTKVYFENNFIYYFSYCNQYEICDGLHQIQFFILRHFHSEDYNYGALLQGGTFSFHISSS